MDARVFDVLHDRADDDAIAVGNRVHVTFKGVLEEAIDEHRPLLRDPRRRREVLLERMGVVDDLHRSTAEHVRRPYQNGIPDAFGGSERFGDARRRTVRRLIEP